MRIELTRGKNNEFYIPKKQYARNELRIMSVDLGSRRLKEDEYYMMGPRKVHINIELNESARIYATIMDIKRGNKVIV